jgi:predicted enzyme related to lactoylglutathione lyase
MAAQMRYRWNHERRLRMGNPVVHWELGGPDPARLSEFYSGLFDWQIKHEPAMEYWMVQTGGEGGIGGGLMKAPHDMPNYLTFYIQVDDLDAYLKKAESLGGKTLVPPTPIPNVGSFAMIADPAGNTVGLFKG